ncbi:hypothetical protein SAPIO_CDS2596 [Scedosporium apiospermum]|uniref:Uncharacterized protein n=1 Tax=Pseudallescheria apiosperma TaxID=563466 RepID=A0A084GCT9_PSEDA|nr:uncharacterized protein SAPIO_CDS2596 [Scedosporium apiospermum]KEZ45151.1 hypothetical protein SAPIO_CDS2596 [Scedosporium apiospermum]
MATSLRSFAVLFALLAVRVMADCVSYGIDYANGGQYYIDAGSNQYFSFVSVFQGCQQEAINPVLVDPLDNYYSCSTISTQPDGQQVTSTCGIPFSAMRSGNWKIIISGDQVNVQRTISLTVGLPETSTVTATPTIVLGITSTPRAVTVHTTVDQTMTLILVPSTVTAPCGAGQTQTVTDYQRVPTVVVEETVTRTETSGQVTSYWQTTETTQARCHYPTKKRDLEGREEAAVAAQTVTYTQTTFTVTQTVVTTIPPKTTTELAFRTLTTTIQPPPTTVCQGGGGQNAVITVNPNRPAVTQTNLVYTTIRSSGTVWVGQTAYTTISNSASATQCWRAGGWYGA